MAMTEFRLAFSEESGVFSPHFPQSAPVAQGIEHRIPNPGVACSIHAGGTNEIKQLSRFLA